MRLRSLQPELPLRSDAGESRHRRWNDASAGDPVVLFELDRVALTALVIFWSSFIAMYTIRSWLLVSNNLLQNMVPRVLVALLGAGLSWGMYRALERLECRTITMRLLSILALSVPISIALAAGDAFIFGLLADGGGRPCTPASTCVSLSPWRDGVDNALNWIFLFSAWGMLHLSARATMERWAVENRAREEREVARIAELRALRYQLNPHFLFNCLNSLATLVRRTDTSDAEAMIGELGAFLRYGLAADPTTDVELGDEVDMQVRYLTLERRRFPERMAFDVAVAESVRCARVPSLILQPLVENAIRHGVAMTSAPTRLSLLASQSSPGTLTIVVENDAWAQNHTKSPVETSTGFGIGLRNVSERLALRFGAAANCIAQVLPRGGFRVVLTMPLVLA